MSYEVGRLLLGFELLLLVFWSYLDFVAKKVGSHLAVDNLVGSFVERSSGPVPNWISGSPCRFRGWWFVALSFRKWDAESA